MATRWILAAAVAMTLAAGPGLAERGPARTYHVRIGAKVGALPEGAKTLEVWVPVPRSGPYQDVGAVRVEAPWPMTLHFDPEYGNAFYHARVENPGAGGFEVAVEFEVTRYEARVEVDPRRVTPLPEDLSPYTQYLSPSQYVRITPQVRRMAAEAVAGKDSLYEKVIALRDLVYDFMEYDKSVPGYGKGDVERACRVRKGNCVDFHTLFMALCYSQGIPVRYVSNADLPFGKMAPNYCRFGFHCAVEVLMPPYGWVPVDISHAKKGRNTKEYYFGRWDYYRVELGYGRNVLLAPPQRGNRLQHVPNYPYIEVDGVPFEGVEPVLLYRDLEKDVSLR